MLQDYKLGVRMLLKFPGLTIAGGLALALAIGIGAGWYDLMSSLFRPALPLPAGDRIVEIEMRNSLTTVDERRLLYEFTSWRTDLKSIADLGAYRNLERDLVVGNARPEPVNVAEITASAFRVARVPPLLGRPLVDADEQPGAPAVVVIGYHVWQRRFGGREDAVGGTLQLGRVKATVVGVMPEGFAFPVNHTLWMPLQIRTSGYAPLEGPPIRIFGRVKDGFTQEQANVEAIALSARVTAASPQTHEHLHPRVLHYGGESPGDRSIIEITVTHLPILFVLIIACANVGTLIYARTATRDGEIATRYALGASRGRIVMQLFVEALVLASVSAIAGLAAAHWALKWGVGAYYAGQTALPFWVSPGLKLPTMVYAAALTVTGAAILGVLPAIKATGAQLQGQLRNLGSGGSTLRFGWVWTTAMIVQVALTVICIPPAMGISGEAWRDRVIRSQFPAAQYLAVRVDLDQELAREESALVERRKQIYDELARRLGQEPGVRAVTFGDRMPGMDVAVRRADVEVSPNTPPTFVPNMWIATVGPGYFEAFDKPLLAGRAFHDGDRARDAKTVIVNEAFARQYFNGASPVGHRVRYAVREQGTPEPWFEIVGMVSDMGMTPTDLGEAPYVYHAASPATVQPAIMGVRVSGDAAGFSPRVRAIASEVDADLRVSDMRPLDEFAWREDLPAVAVAGTLAAVVCLGLFLSAAGIFSLMAVSVARRTREIGLRAALGASPARLLAGVFSRAVALIGGGIAAGNAVLLIGVILAEARIAVVVQPLLITSALMMAVGLLACIEPARRALRIQPVDALKET